MSGPARTRIHIASWPAYGVVLSALLAAVAIAFLPLPALIPILPALAAVWVAAVRALCAPEVTR